MRILMTAIRPLEESIGPPGIHLRWSLPSELERQSSSPLARAKEKSLGFPEKGFTVYRRRHENIKPRKLGLPTIKPGEKPKSLTSQDAFLYPDPQTKLVSEGNGWTIVNSGQLLIRFEQPAVYCEIQFGSANDVNEIKAYQGRRLLTSSQTTTQNGRLQVIGSYFDHVLFTLNFEQLKQILFLSEKDFCAEPDWVPLATLDHLGPSQIGDARNRLEKGLHNRYAKSRPLAIKKYSPHIEELLTNQNSIIDTNADAPISASDFVDDCPQGAQVGDLSTRNLLLSTATDPNLAKIMGLYWVDQFDSKNPPTKGQSYDYKVEGLYRGKPVCGLVLGVGKDVAPRPTVSDLKTVAQLPGFRWKNRDPLVRVGLDWKHMASTEPTSTILYDVYRQLNEKDGFVRLTEDSLVSGQTNGTPKNSNSTIDFSKFVDRNIPLGTYTYQISGVDIFGQESKTSGPKQVEVKDTTPPPPPVRLKCSVQQPGCPWLDPEELARQIDQNDLDVNAAEIRLSFEYGHAQHRQAPDAKEIVLYWREDNLRIIKMATVIQVDEESAGDGLARLRIKLSDISGNELQQFDGGILSIKSRGGRDLPNSERTPVRIEKIESDRVVLRPSQIQLLSGDLCELTSDIHNRKNWHSFGGKIKIQPALRAGLADIRDAKVHVKAHHKITTDDADSAANIANTLPGNLRPEDSASLPPVTELLIDRELLEPNLFSNGKLIKNNNTTVPIVYSTAGVAYSQQVHDRPPVITRIAVDPPNSVGVNQIIALESTLDFDMYGDPVRYVVKEVILDIVPRDFDLRASGGEVVFEWLEEKCGEKEIVAVTARVVSAARKHGETHTSLLVKIRKSDWIKYGQSGLLFEKATASYYAPYVVDPISTSIFLDDNAHSAPSWHWSSESGVLRGYIASTATDDRSQEGSLSQPVEASVFKPPPTGRPNPPFPCDLQLNDLDSIEHWYASPPDLDGLATACLKWAPDGISQPEGLRCEIARALDTTVIEADKKNWLLGLHDPGFPSVTIDILQVRDPNANDNDGDVPNDVVIVQFKPLTGNITDESFFSGGGFIQNDGFFVLTGHKLTKTGSDENLSFEASVTSSTGLTVDTAQNATFYRGGIVVFGGASFPVVNPTTTLHNGQVLLTIDLPNEVDLADRVVRSKFIGARLSTDVGTGVEPTTNHFKISKISPNRNDEHEPTGRLDFLLQPQIGNRTEVGNEATLHPSPSYDLAKPNDFLLRELADKPANISAFGVVTGTPVTSDNNEFRFRDQLPGIGSNRYFYKVRGKDASENNTVWSQTSIPFYQVDTSPPNTPLRFNVTPGDRSALLTWQRSMDPTATSFKVYRVEETAGSSQQNIPEEVYSDVPRSHVVGAPLRVAAGAVRFPSVVEVGELVTGVEIVAELTAGAPVNLFIENGRVTQLNSRNIENLNPLFEDDTPIVAVFEKNGQRTKFTQRPGSGLPLTILNHTVDLGFDLNIAEIVGLYKAADIQDSTDLDQIESPDLINLFDAHVEPSMLTITGFSGNIFDGTEVLAVVLLSNGAKTVLKHQPGTLEPLRVSGDVVSLDIDLTDQNLVSVHRLPPDLHLDQLDDLPDLTIKVASRMVYRTDADDQIQSVADLNPLASAGTPVRVTVHFASGRKAEFDSHPMLEQWTDHAVEGGHTYLYWVSALRTITRWVQTNNASQPLQIESPLSEPSKIVAIDRSALKSPVIQEVAWVGDPEQLDTQAIRITVDADGSLPFELMIEFSKDGGQKWNKANLTSGFGWITWPSGLPQTSEHYRPTSLDGIRFRARTRSSDNRVSRPSATASLSPFVEDVT